MSIRDFQFRIESTGQWVDASLRDPTDEDGIRFLGTPKGDLTFLYEDIPGQGWDQNRLDQWVAIANEWLLNRIDRASLPADHPYIKNGDPGLDWLYWDGTDVVERMLVIEDVSYDPTAGLNFGIRRIRRGIWSA